MATRASVSSTAPIRRGQLRAWAARPGTCRRGDQHDGLKELARDRGARASGRLRSRSHPHRPLRRARPRILHRPGLRGRAHLRDAGRGRQADPLRLGRRRRALRRAGRALSRRAGPGDRLFDRRLAAARGVARDQKPDRRGGRNAGSGRRAGARPRRGLDGELPAPRRQAARRRDRRRALSRRRAK